MYNNKWPYVHTYLINLQQQTKNTTIYTKYKQYVQYIQLYTSDQNTMTLQLPLN